MRLPTAVACQLPVPILSCTGSRAAGEPSSEPQLVYRALYARANGFRTRTPVPARKVASSTSACAPAGCAKKTSRRTDVLQHSPICRFGRPQLSLFLPRCSQALLLTGFQTGCSLSGDSPKDFPCAAGMCGAYLPLRRVPGLSAAVRWADDFWANRRVVVYYSNGTQAKQFL